MEQTSAEFIKNRSFEIAWAVFRCANLIKQPALKAELENVSVGLVSGFGNADNLEKLEQLIRLAEAVGQISKTNALVLFREIDNLKEIVRQRNSAIRQSEEESSAMDKIFIKAPLSLFSNNNSAIVRQSPSVVSSGPNGSPQVVRHVQDRSEKSSASSAIVRQDSSAIKSSLPIVRSPYGRSPEGRQSNEQNNEFLSEDRQNMVFRKVKDMGKVTTKELLGFFPDISERTVRLHLQRLSEQGLISRIGSSGPGSYYVAK